MKQASELWLVPMMSLLMQLPSQVAWAQAGVKGGDIECENAIRSYYFPTLQHWLISGGPENAGGPTDGKLNLSSTRYPGTNQPYTLKQYEEGMESVIPVDNGLIDDRRLHINCVSPGDPGWPVDVNDSAKICSSDLKNGDFYIKCRAAKFVAIDQVKSVDTVYSGVPASERYLNANEAIEQIHHESATWVEGLEPDLGDVSTYEISRQLSDHVRFFQVPVLVVGTVATEERPKPPADLDDTWGEIGFLADPSMGGTMWMVGSQEQIPAVYQQLSFAQQNQLLAVPCLQSYALTSKNGMTFRIQQEGKRAESISVKQVYSFHDDKDSQSRFPWENRRNAWFEGWNFLEEDAHPDRLPVGTETRLISIQAETQSSDGRHGAHPVGGLVLATMRVVPDLQGSAVSSLQVRRKWQIVNIESCGGVFKISQRGFQSAFLGDTSWVSPDLKLPADKRSAERWSLFH